MCILNLDVKRAMSLTVPNALKALIDPRGGLAEAVKGGLPPGTKEPQIQQAIEAATADIHRAKVSPHNAKPLCLSCSMQWVCKQSCWGVVCGNLVNLSTASLGLVVSMRSAGRYCLIPNITKHGYTKRANRADNIMHARQSWWTSSHHAACNINLMYIITKQCETTNSSVYVTCRTKLVGAKQQLLLVALTPCT